MNKIVFCRCECKFFIMHVGICLNHGKHVDSLIYYNFEICFKNFRKKKKAAGGTRLL